MGGPTTVDQTHGTPWDPLWAPLMPLEEILRGFFSMAGMLRPGIGSLGVSRRTVCTIEVLEGFLEEAIGTKFLNDTTTLAILFLASCSRNGPSVARGRWV